VLNNPAPAVVGIGASATGEWVLIVGDEMLLARLIEDFLAEMGRCRIVLTFVLIYDFIPR
jgi:hypothetical protein